MIKAKKWGGGVHIQMEITYVLPPTTEIARQKMIDR